MPLNHSMCIKELLYIKYPSKCTVHTNTYLLCMQLHVWSTQKNSFKNFPRRYPQCITCTCIAFKNIEIICMSQYFSSPPPPPPPPPPTQHTHTTIKPGYMYQSKFQGDTSSVEYTPLKIAALKIVETVTFYCYTCLPSLWSALTFAFPQLRYK